MATSADLMGLGTPPAVADLLGFTPATVAGATTAQATGTLIGTAFTLATTSGGATAFRLPTSPVGAPLYFFNTSATAALVYPPVGGSINGGSTNASVSVGQNTGLVFILASGASTYPYRALTTGTSGSAGSFTTLAASGATTLADTLSVAGLSTFAGIGSTVPLQKYNTANNTADFTATGANVCGGLVKNYLNLTGTLGAGRAITLPTVVDLVTAIGVAGGNPQIGSSYELEIFNLSSANFAWTVTTNTGWTITGTPTIAQNTSRRFIVTFTTLSAAVLQSLGGIAITAI